MLNSPVALAVVAAAFFAIWPFISRFAGLSPGWISLLFAVGTGLPALFVLSSPSPSFRSIGIGLIAGMINGLGLLAFSRMISWEGIELSRVLPITFVLMTGFSVLCALLVLGEPLTAKKMLGITFALVSVYLLS